MTHAGFTPQDTRFEFYKSLSKHTAQYTSNLLFDNTKLFRRLSFTIRSSQRWSKNRKRKMHVVRIMRRFRLDFQTNHHPISSYIRFFLGYLSEVRIVCLKLGESVFGEALGICGGDEIRNGIKNESGTGYLTDTDRFLRVVIHHVLCLYLRRE